MNDTPFLKSCLHKQKQLKESFSSCTSPEKKYEKIIEFGRQLPPYPTEFKTPDYLVKGCQSTLYLHSTFKEGKVYFQVYSEALISAGLSALLLAVYNEEPPEAILSCPPLFLQELGILNSLSPSRSNGVASLFQRMKQIALNHLYTSGFKNR